MAGDFDLTVEVTAETAKLDAGLQKADQSVKRTAANMEQSTRSANEKLEDTLSLIGKIAAPLFIAEGAFKGAGAALRGMAGDGDMAIEMLKGLPLVGGLVTSFFEFADALEYVGETATDAREATLQLSLTLGDLERGVARSRDRLADYTEMWKLQGKTATEIAKLTTNMTFKMLKDQEILERAAADRRHEERMKEIDDAHLARREELALQVEEMQRHEEELEEIRESFRRKNILNRARAVAAEQEEQRKATEAAEQKAAEERLAREKAATEEKKKIAEEMHAFMEEKHKEELARIAEREKAEKEAADAAKKAAEVRMKFAKAAHTMQTEMAAARLAAEKAVAGMVSTFSTAGGAFTTGVSAQVSEQKLLTSISQQSRDFLAQIAANTARLGGFA